MTAPATTSYGVWISASTRVWETRSAMINATNEITTRWSVTMNVIAAQQPNASAAWPEGSPPRSGVPVPVIALTAMTTIIVRTSAMTVRLMGASPSAFTRRALGRASRSARTR